MQVTYPHLFSFARKPKCSLRYFLDQEVERIFKLPLSSQAELEQIEELLEEKDWNINVHNKWSYSWGNAKYSSKKAYNLLIGHSSITSFLLAMGIQQFGETQILFLATNQRQVEHKEYVEKKKYALRLL